MERLTKRINGVCVYVGPGCEYPSTGEISAELTTEKVRAVMRRLTAYEDAGLEPEDITAEQPSCVFYCNRRCNLDGDWCIEGPGCQKEINKETAICLLNLAKTKAARETQKAAAREKEKAEAFVPETADGICCGKLDVP